MDTLNMRMMEVAKLAASWSKDESTKVGCVIFDPYTQNPLAQANNGFARGVNDTIPERNERPAKYKYTVHAEINAIALCAYHGVMTQAKSMVSTFFPCAPCASAAVQAGIVQLVVPETDFEHERWGEDFQISRKLLHEANVSITYLTEVTRPEGGTRLVEVIDFVQGRAYCPGEYVLHGDQVLLRKEGSGVIYPSPSDIWEKISRVSEPQPWSPGKTYRCGDKASFMGRVLRSRLGEQNGFCPAIYPNQWSLCKGAPFDTIHSWFDYLTYAPGQLCHHYGRVYVAKVTVPCGKDPEDNPDFWEMQK